MRLPIRQLSGHLLWTTYGVVWAIYRVNAAATGRPTARQSRQILDSHTAALKSLTGQPMLASLCPQTDPVRVVARMIAGLDLEQHPEWAENVEDTLDELSELAMTDRTHWLALPLLDGDSTTLRRAATRVSQFLGVAEAPIGAEEIDRRAAQAAAAVGNVYGVGLRPATQAEVLWWLARAPRRGLDEPPLPDAIPDYADPDAATGLRVGKARPGGRAQLAALEDVVLDEAGKSDGVDGDLATEATAEVAGGIRAAGRSALAVAKQFRRRYLKVITEHGASYQALMVLADMPGQFTFPGSEWLARLDGFGFGVDWVARLEITPNEKAAGKARKQARELDGQLDEWSDDVSGPPPELDEAQRQLVDQRDRLAASKTEVEVQASVVLCVWAETPREVNRRAELVRATFGVNNYQICRPIGSQTDLYLAMYPGVPTPKTLLDYRQYLLAADFAMAMPWQVADVGDPIGGLLGFSLDGTGCRPVLYDPSYGPQINRSASVAAISELGGGKSAFLKKTMFEVLARLGGRVIALDRTPLQEYVRFAEACPGTVRCIEVTDTPRHSLDPLRIFRGNAAKRHTFAFLNVLLDIPPNSPAGVVLRKAIADLVDSEPQQTRSSRRLLQVLLDRAAHHPAAAEIAARLEVFADEGLGAVIFDTALPAVELMTADALIFATSAVPLPKREELADPRTAERLPAEKVLGRAVHLMIAAICREVAFYDPRFVMVCFDECYSVNSSAEGEALVMEIVRDGRKHAAMVALGGHDVTDLGNDTIRGLISTRLLGRHTDPTLARAGLAWLGLDPGDPELVDLVTRDLSPARDNPAEAAARAGEFLLRDVRDRVGKVKVHLPPYRDVAEKIVTTPTWVTGPTSVDMTLPDPAEPDLALT